MTIREAEPDGGSGSAAAAARAAVAPAGVRDDALVLAAAAAESALAGGLAAGLPIALMLTGHLAVVAGIGAVLLRRPAGGDARALLVTLLATAACGPVGALGGLLTSRLLARRTVVTPLLAAWYDRIALATTVHASTRACDAVEMGRALDTAAPAPPAFAETMSTGTLPMRQAALGLIARRFGSDYVPALKVALASPEPVVRVQAAAVAARVRDEIAARIREIADRATSDGLSLADGLLLAVEAEDLAASGLVGDADRERSVAAARLLRARLSAWPGPAGLPAALSMFLRSGAADPARRLRLAAALDEALLAAGRTADLRKARKLAGALPTPYRRAVGLSQRRRRGRPAGAPVARPLRRAGRAARHGAGGVP